MKKFLIKFLLFSIIGIIFFRPLFFKKELKIEFEGNAVIDSVYYSYGFPISTIVSEVYRNKEREYNLRVEHIRGELWLGLIDSDIERIKAKKFFSKLPKGWQRISYWLVSKDSNYIEPIELKIRARDYIDIAVRNDIEGEFKVMVNNRGYVFKTKIDTTSVMRFRIDLKENKSSYEVLISPESKFLILKFKEDISDIRVRDYKYKKLNQNSIIVNGINIDYLGILGNILIVISYCSILSIILTYSKSHFLKFFSIFFTISLIYLLSYFPGIYNPDSLDQVRQAYNLRMDDLKTPFHTFSLIPFVAFIRHIGYYTLLQIITQSVLFAWILRKLGVDNLKLSILLLAFPITGLYSIYVVKDVPYSLCLLWFSFLLYFAYHNKNYLKNNLNLVCFIISLSFIMLFRHNGIPFVIVLLVLMLIGFRRELRRVLIIWFFIFLIFITHQLVFYGVLKTKRTFVLYQKDFFILSHYVVKNYRFNNEERYLIESILSFEEIKKRYKCERMNFSLWWNSPFNREKFTKEKEKMRKLLIKVISKDTYPFLEHILCSSAYIWSFNAYSYFINDIVDYKHNNFIYRDYPLARLYADVKFPQIQMLIELITSQLENHLNFLFKPPLYFYFLVILFIINKNLRIVIIPYFINTVILVVLSIDNQFRYLYPNYLISLILIIYLLNNFEISKFLQRSF